MATVPSSRLGADALGAAIPEGLMDPAAMYEFDVNGVIVFRNVLDAGAVQRMNTAIDGDGLAGTESPAQSNGGFGFPVPWAADPVFLETMAGEAVLSVARVMCGDWLRLDHAYGIQMNDRWDGKANLHGGARTDQGEHQYQWHQNRMYNGLIVVMFALHPVREGDGGFICVPGSHRANVPFRPPVDHSMVINPTLEPGDMLVFTEALVHGTTYWTNERVRRSILFKYIPGYSTWGDPAFADAIRPLVPKGNDTALALLQPPGVGGRSPVPGLPGTGAYGDANYQVSQLALARGDAGKAPASTRQVARM